MSYEGIIFDFNGVLWWDSHLHEYAWNRFSEIIRGRPLSAEEFTIHIHGRNNKDTLEYLIGSPLNKREIESLTQQKETIYRQLCLNQKSEFKLSPGSIELLNYLVKQNVPHTIATASEKSNLDFFVENLLLDKWFDLDKIVYDTGLLPGKPAPDIYLGAATRLGIDPSKCIVVEDSISGIEAAYAAGIGYIIALGPEDKHTSLIMHKGVNKVIENLGEILKFKTLI